MEHELDTKAEVAPTIKEEAKGPRSQKAAKEEKGEPVFQLPKIKLGQKSKNSDSVFGLSPRTPPAPPKPVVPPKPVLAPEEPEKKEEFVIEGFLRHAATAPQAKTPPKEEMHSPYFEPEEETPEMERLLYPSGSYPSSLRRRLRRNSGKE